MMAPYPRTNQGVADCWWSACKGRDTDAGGRTANGNLWFANLTLYSYQTAIARPVRAPNGERWMLVNDHHYSATTSGKHYTARRRALSHGDFCNNWHEVCLDGESLIVSDPSVTHVLDQLARVETCVGEAERARTHGPMLTRQARRAYLDAETLAQAFKLSIPVPESLFDRLIRLAHKHNLVAM